MIKIGLEASRANKKEKTGTEWYAWHLLQQFKQLDTTHKFVVYYNQPLTEDLIKAPANFYFKQLKWPFKKFWTHIKLSLELLTKPVDKFFATNSAPLFSRGELIVTIHDLGFYKNPELYHPLERIYQKLSHALAIKKAQKIITISEFTKQDILKYFPQAKEKIKVIPLGYDVDSFVPRSEEDNQDIRDKYSLPDKYIIYVGRIETKKNIQNLIKAYKLLNTDWPLVLVGRPGNYGYQEIKKLANQKVIFLGYIDHRDYPRLLSASTIFVFPSKFEGFGIPVLEAMSSKIPVVCSDIPALHEIAQEAVIYFNPDNVEDMAQKIQQVIDSQELRGQLQEKGLYIVKNYSWQKCAQQTLEYILK